MKDYIIIFITTSNQKEAEKIARILVEKKLAACVNIIPGISSIYRWQGKIEKAEEFLLVVKTKQSLWMALAKEVLKKHSYEVPEVIALPLIKGLRPYLNWLDSAVRK